MPTNQQAVMHRSVIHGLVNIANSRQMDVCMPFAVTKHTVVLGLPAATTHWIIVYQPHAVGITADCIVDAKTQHCG